MELPDYNFDAIVIIGNGFDLSLGLKTSYTDFVKSKEFKLLLENENLLAKHLDGIHTLENWIDIENELKNYSKRFSRNNDNFFNEFKNLSSALKEYLNNLKDINLNEDLMAVKIIKAVENLPTLIIDFNYTDTVSKIAEFLKFDINTKNSHIHHMKIHGSLDTTI